jgi:hypothetical protein
MKMKIIEQLELGYATDASSLNHTSIFPRHAGRKRIPKSRSALWFARMRLMVDRAMDWSPTPPARPEQIRLPSPFTHHSLIQ